RRQGILLVVIASERPSSNANREQDLRGPASQRLAIRRQLHWSGHHLAVQGQVEDFLAVLIPAGLCSALVRDLKLPARSRKRQDVDLEPARFVRLVRDPLAVGGELAIAFVKRSLLERQRLLIFDAQNPRPRARAR